MKNKITFLILGLLLSIFLISFISARSDCVPASCPSGYTDDGVSGGGSDGNLITRTCSKAIAGYCGTTVQTTGSVAQTFTNPARGSTKILADYTLSSNYCWRQGVKMDISGVAWNIIKGSEYVRGHVQNSPITLGADVIDIGAPTYPSSSSGTEYDTSTPYRGDGNGWAGLGNWNSNGNGIGQYPTVGSMTLTAYYPRYAWNPATTQYSNQQCRNPTTPTVTLTDPVINQNAQCSISSSYAGSYATTFYDTTKGTNSGALSGSNPSWSNSNFAVGDQLYCRGRTTGSQGTTPGVSDYANSATKTVASVDTVAPTTTATAVSPIGSANSYTFGSTAGENVSVGLSCADGGTPTSGCAATYYCTDTINSCSPGSVYSGAVPFTSEGTFYIRYYSTDAASNSEAVSSRQILISTQPQITLNSPADGLSSQDPLNKVFNATARVFNDVDIFKNMTLTILYNNGSLFYNETKTITGKTATVTFTKTFSAYDDFKWNMRACTESNKCVSSENRTLILYEGMHLFQTLLPSQTSFLGNTNAIATFTQAQNNPLIGCLFTVKSPTQILINSGVGTSSSPYMIWNSSNFLTSELGNYNITAICQDRFSFSYALGYVFNVAHTLTLSDNTFSLSTANAIDEQKNYTITAYDNSPGNILLNLASSIENSSYFTQRFDKSFILLNSSDSISNKIPFTYFVNASALTPGGTYRGSITLSNSTYSLSYQINFTYAVSGKSGNPEIYSTLGQKCTSSNTDPYCSSRNGITQGQSVALSYVVNNTGEWDMQNCSAYLTSNIDLFNMTNIDSGTFDLAQNATKTINVNFVSSVSSTSIGTYDGNFYVQCQQGDQFGNAIKTKGVDSPYISIGVAANNDDGNGNQPGGGAGGGGSNPIIIGKGNATWSMKTDNGAGSYEISTSAGGQRTKNIIFTNLGNGPQAISIRCDGATICDFITFDKTEIVLPALQDATDTARFNLNLNGNVTEGTYLINIVGKDAGGMEGVLPVTFIIGKVGFLSNFLNKITTSTQLFGASVPYFALFMVSGVLFFFAGFFLFYNFNTRETLALIIALIGGLITVAVL